MPRPSDPPPASESSSTQPSEEIPLVTFFEAILDELPVVVFVKEGKERRFVYANERFAALHDCAPAELVGKNDEELMSASSAAKVRENDLLVLEQGECLDIPEETFKLKGVGLRSFHTRKIPLRDAQGKPRYLLGIAEDITARKQAEETLAKERELLETQRRLLELVRELGTPVLPVMEGILVVPLVGHMDADRSAQFMEALLAAIQAHRAEIVLIDITGVPVMDEGVAGHLMQATGAAALLGTHCVLVGVSPEVARTLVELGVDLGSLVTQRDLQAGILYALSRQGKSVVKRRVG